MAAGLTIVPHVRPFGLVLAGGRATRLGGLPKPLQMAGGRPLLAHVLARLAPQCAEVAISARGDPAPWRPYAAHVLDDPEPESLGPLAGVLAGLRYLETAGGPDRLLTVPGDTPFIPPDLAVRLAAAASGDRPAIAATDDRLHPAVALWPVALRPVLEDRLLRQRAGGVLRFLEIVGYAVVRWPAAPFDPFFNVNTFADLSEADATARRFGS